MKQSLRNNGSYLKAHPTDAWAQLTKAVDLIDVNEAFRLNCRLP